MFLKGEGMKLKIETSEGVAGFGLLLDFQSKEYAILFWKWALVMEWRNVD